MMLRPFYPGATHENIIGKTDLARACSAICDICGHGRNSKAHRANRCSEKRREMSLAAARLLEQHNAIGSGR